MSNDNNAKLPLQICSSSTEKRHQQGPPPPGPPSSKRPSPVFKRPPPPPNKLSAQPSFQTPVLATRRPERNPQPPQSPNSNGYGAPPIRSSLSYFISFATHTTYICTLFNLALGLSTYS